MSSTTFAFSLGAAAFFAPCAIPLLPGYLAFYLGTADGDPSLSVRLRRGVAFSVLAGVGVLAVYVGLAGVAVALGATALADVSVLEGIVALALIPLGVAMATGRGPQLHVALPERRRTGVGFLAFGAAYAAAAAGCTAPLFLGVANVALAAGPVGGVVTVGAYAAGMVGALAVVTMLAAAGKGALVRRLSARSGLITTVAGVALVAAGLVQLYYFLFRFDGLATLGL